ncbi:MAG: hypothetical protein OEY44_00625 [Candidatus Peregrinibacteria bacterium]|nr:hypothetical protein [Candidatus Peregrinibacteria bacterium]
MSEKDKFIYLSPVDRACFEFLMNGDFSAYEERAEDEGPKSGVRPRVIHERTPNTGEPFSRTRSELKHMLEWRRGPLTLD